MESPIELLADHVNQNRVLGRRKFVHAFRPKRNGEPDQQDRLDQHNGKFEMGGNSTANTGVIGFRVAAPAKTDQDENEKGRPPKEESAHKPVREFDNVIDLVAMLGGVWREANKFVNEREA